jgi:Protein of Unknown function (DUF2604)
MAKKLTLTIVVNGQPTSVEANEEEPLGALIPRALEQTGNTGQPPDQWELRDAAGDVLNPSRKVESYGFAPGTTLFLNLRAGIGGHR